MQSTTHESNYSSDQLKPNTIKFATECREAGKPIHHAW